MNEERINDASKQLMQGIMLETSLQSINSESIENLEFEEIECKAPIKEYLNAPIGSEKDAQFKKLEAAAIVIAQQNDCLPFEMSNEPFEIATTIDEGLNRTKVAYQTATGQLDPIEAVDILIDNAAARTKVAVDYAIESGAISDAITREVVVLLKYFEVPSPERFAPIIKNIARRVEKPIQKFVKKGIDIIAKTAKKTVHKIASSIKNFLIDKAKKVITTTTTCI